MRSRCVMRVVMRIPLAPCRGHLNPNVGEAGPASVGTAVRCIHMSPLEASPASPCRRGLNGSKVGYGPVEWRRAPFCSPPPVPGLAWLAMLLVLLAPLVSRWLAHGHVAAAAPVAAMDHAMHRARAARDGRAPRPSRHAARRGHEESRPPIHMPIMRWVWTAITADRCTDHPAGGGRAAVRWRCAAHCAARCGLPRQISGTLGARWAAGLDGRLSRAPL